MFAHIKQTVQRNVYMSPHTRNCVFKFEKKIKLCLIQQQISVEKLQLKPVTFGCSCLFSHSQASIKHEYVVYWQNVCNLTPSTQLMQFKQIIYRLFPFSYRSVQTEHRPYKNFLKQSNLLTCDSSLLLTVTPLWLLVSSLWSPCIFNCFPFPQRALGEFPEKELQLQQMEVQGQGVLENTSVDGQVHIQRDMKRLRESWLALYNLSLNLHR